MNQDKNDMVKKESEAKTTREPRAQRAARAGKGPEATAPRAERRVTGVSQREEQPRPVRDHNRRWLFLVADLVLLAVIFVAIFFLVSLLTPLSLFSSGGDEVRTVTYTVEFTGVEKDAFATLRKGDAVVDKTTGNVIGTVTDFEPRKYVVYTDRPTDEKDEALDSYVVTKAEYPEEFTTLAVTITVQADYTVGIGYTVEDCRIAVGREYELNFPGCAGKGVCVDFRAE